MRFNVSNQPVCLNALSNKNNQNGKWVNAASKWCNYELRARVYPRSLTHLPPVVRCKVHLQMVHSSHKLVRLLPKKGAFTN
ncbi:BQ5605_C007g04678 [Microbotryum silenes-dioicae]|uniref:BQ5605_C007g04678 protein n=1 Tax=Microbotryum silenes-dioicae TaxID=796604 RepID=A0A2X0P393_9BASI|nr:BQ5605_C007g04678 [Microbotryum silenes-dioicae]